MGDCDQNDWLQTLTGTRVRIRTPGTATANRICIIDYIEPPNTAPPIYTRHEFVEVFSIVSGTLQFQFPDEARLQLTAGDSVTCPSFKPHSFWNETDAPAHALLVCSPAGLDQFFIDSHELLRGESKDIERRMKALRDKYGLEHVGSAPR